MLALVLLIAAVVCALLATFAIAAGRINLLAAAVALYLLAVLVPAISTAIPD